MTCGWNRDWLTARLKAWIGCAATTWAAASCPSGAHHPAWIPNNGGKQWAVIALLDYGPEPVEFGARVPLGVNMAFKRHAFDRAGLLDPQHRPPRRNPARPRGARVVHPGAPGGRARVLRSGNGRSHIIPATRLCKALLSPLVLLARDQQSVALRTRRPGHGSPGAKALWTSRKFRISAASHCTYIGRQPGTTWARWITLCHSTGRGRQRSTTRCGCGSSPAS